MSESLFAALHEQGWHNLLPEQQDALIASGWHPGPRPDWAERVVLEPREYAALVDELHALRKQTVTESVDSPITDERPRDVGAPGAVT